MKQSFWFYLEPYIHISLKRDFLLLYNPLNAKVIELPVTSVIRKLTSRLISKKNLWVIKINAEELQNKEISEFINQIKNFFMGDLLDTRWSKRKPFQIIPELKFMNDFRGFQEKDNPLGIDVKRYLKVISFYINADPSGIQSRRLDDAYKQFLWPGNTAQKLKELPLESIIRLLDESVKSDLCSINILGKNLLTYSQIESLTAYLNSLPVLKSYYIHYLDLEYTPLEKLTPFLIQGELNLALEFPIKIEALLRIVKTIDDSENQVRYRFACEKEEDIENAQQLISQYDLQSVSFHPYYNGENAPFFKDMVFISKDDILESRPTQLDILARSITNPNFFGKLTVLTNGHIYADVNSPRIGKLGIDSVYDVLYKELSGEKSWRRSRMKVMPCKQCVYNCLCPPLSNYEAIFKQNNPCQNGPVGQNEDGSSKGQRED